MSTLPSSLQCSSHKLQSFALKKKKSVFIFCKKFYFPDSKQKLPSLALTFHSLWHQAFTPCTIYLLLPQNSVASNNSKHLLSLIGIQEQLSWATRTFGSLLGVRDGSGLSSFEGLTGIGESSFKVVLACSWEISADCWQGAQVLHTGNTPQGCLSFLMSW